MLIFSEFFFNLSVNQCSGCKISSQSKLHFLMSHLATIMPTKPFQYCAVMDPLFICCRRNTVGLGLGMKKHNWKSSSNQSRLMTKIRTRPRATQQGCLKCRGSRQRSSGPNTGSNFRERGIIKNKTLLFIDVTVTLNWSGHEYVVAEPSKEFVGPKVVNVSKSRRK